MEECEGIFFEDQVSEAEVAEDQPVRTVVPVPPSIVGLRANEAWFFGIDGQPVIGIDPFHDGE